MRQLAKRRDIRIDSLTLITSEISTDILAGDTILMTVSERDAAFAGLPRIVLASQLRAFSIGDRVKIADTVGDVMSRTLLITRIRTVKNVEVTIPNSMVLGSHIVNFSTLSQDQGLILHTSVTIGYDVPWKKVHELLINAAGATEHILASPPPFVLQTSLDDFYVSYELNAYTKTPQNMAGIYSELHQKIQDQFNASGVEILSPHFSALRDGNQIAIPENYLPKSYQAPSFRIVSTGADQVATNHRNK